MLYAIQPAPFSEADRQRQYEAVAAALAAELGAAPTVLLGNPGPWADLTVDALLLQPNCLVLLTFTPTAGRLDLPAQPQQPWVLAGQPLPTRAGAANPLAHYQAQLPAAQAWVAEQLGRPVAELPPSLGVALFEGPLTFGPGVEGNLHHAAGTDDFELLGGAERLPARLRALPATDFITGAELIDWATYLLSLAPVAASSHSPSDQTPAAYLLHQLGRLWQWLGAADVPLDPPYGSAPAPTLAPRDQQEQEARLHELRRELQTELRQQRQEAAARETAYQQELLRLQQQVLQAGSVAGAQQAQAAEAARQAAQAELATRTQELDWRIQQLGQLIGQLQAAPARPAALPARPVASPARAAAGPAQVRQAASAKVQPALWQQLRPAERRALLGVALVGLLGAGGWRLYHRPGAPAPARPVAAHRQLAQSLPADEVAPPPVYVVDSSLAPLAARPGEATTDNDGLTESPSTPSLTVQQPKLQIDSQQVISGPTPTPADSTSSENSPAP